MTSRSLSKSRAIDCRFRIVPLLSIGLAFLDVQAQSVYQITDNVTGGIDLTAMEGYYSDRLAGPTDAEVVVEGEIKHSPNSNPFQIIGHGKKITFKSETTITNVPVLVLPAEGVKTRTDIAFGYAAHFRKGIEFRKYTRLVIPDGKSFAVYGYGSEAVDFTVDGGGLYGYEAPVVGNAHGDANLKVLNGSYFYNTYDFYLGQEKSPGRNGAPLYITADIRAEFHARNLLLLSGVPVPSGTSAKECCFVTNGVDGIIKVWSIHHSGGHYSRIVFDGGRLVSRDENNNAASKGNALFHVTGIDWAKKYPNPHMMVESANGHPIDIEIPVDRKFSGGSKNRQVNVSGDGGLTKRGAGILAFSIVPFDNSSKLSKCTLTGPTKVLGGGIVLENENYKPGRGALEVSKDAFFDVNGIDVEFAGATGEGVLTNSSEVSTLALGYGNEDATFDIPVIGDFAVVKTGSGTLTVGKRLDGFSGNVAIEDGTVVVEPGVSLSAGKLAIGKNAVLNAGEASIGVSHLSVDASSETSSIGVLRPSANGTLEVSGLASGSGNIHELPIVAENIEDEENLETWTVVLNGKTKSDARIYLLNGRMHVSTSGFSIRIR